MSIKLDKPDQTLWFSMQILYSILHLYRDDDSDRLQIQGVPKTKPNRPKNRRKSCGTKFDHGRDLRALDPA